MDDKTLKYMADRVEKGKTLARDIEQTEKLHEIIGKAVAGDGVMKLELGDAGDRTYRMTSVGFLLGVSEAELFNLLLESLQDVVARYLARLRDEYAAL